MATVSVAMYCPPEEEKNHCTIIRATEVTCRSNLISPEMPGAWKGSILPRIQSIRSQDIQPPGCTTLYGSCYINILHCNKHNHSSQPGSRVYREYIISPS